MTHSPYQVAPGASTTSGRGQSRSWLLVERFQGVDGGFAEYWGASWAHSRAISDRRFARGGPQGPAVSPRGRSKEAVTAHGSSEGDTRIEAMSESVEHQPLPLLFTFKHVIQGRGFIAGVRMSGRALLEQEDGEHWIMGVAPVGWSGGGMTRNEAFQDFRNGWTEILFDISAKASSFAEFKAEASTFLKSKHEGFAAQWDEALARVRREAITDPDLRSESAEEHRIDWEVVELKPCDSEPDRNEIEPGLSAAA